jgi:phosphatidate phosphatase APP1
MANWQKILAEMVLDVEKYYDLLKYRLRERIGGRNPIMILPYRGYGTPDKVYLIGRVLEDKGITQAMENDTLWDNLVNMYKRFETDEIPYAKVLARFRGDEVEITANIEGFFEVWFDPQEPLPQDRLWHRVELELLEPDRTGYPPVEAEGLILVPPPSAQFGVISDIDDTVMYTDAANLIRMARNVFLGNARTRLPFNGVAAFYRSLMRGGQEHELNPLFYVSSSPWNVYDLLSEFFQLRGIPLGPVLFLRDWGLNEDELLPTHHRDYKMAYIQKILATYPHLPFIFIGDSGQKDPEIYAEVVAKHPGRINAIYIRNVSQDPRRDQSIGELAEGVREAGSVLILADDTLPMARHAAEQGWIPPGDLPEIEAEIEVDSAPPSPVEKLINQVEGQSGGEEPPTVIVDGQDEQQD